MVMCAYSRTTAVDCFSTSGFTRAHENCFHHMRLRICGYLLRDRRGVHPFGSENLADPGLG